MRRAAPSLVAFLAALVLITGCGEKEEPTVTGPAETATTTATLDDTELAYETVEDFLISNDAARVCDEELTEAFVRASFGDRAGCIESRKPGDLATGATIERPSIEGNAATASARPRGGAYDGEVVDFELLLQGDQWRIDTIDTAPAGP